MSDVMLNQVKRPNLAWQGSYINNIKCTTIYLQYGHAIHTHIQQYTTLSLNYINISWMCYTFSMEWYTEWIRSTVYDIIFSEFNQYSNPRNQQLCTSQNLKVKKK